jgi:ketosteroid isomerase-like protein
MNRMCITTCAAAITAGLFFSPAEAAEALSLAALEARLQILEDREAIRNLIIDYGTYHDHRDYRALAALFAEEGVWSSGMGSGKGPEGVFRLMDDTIGHNPLPDGSGTFHILTNDRISVEGDKASAVTKWVYVTAGEHGGPQTVLLGHYTDQFIREKGRWKFLLREAPVDLPAME